LTRKAFRQLVYLMPIAGSLMIAVLCAFTLVAFQFPSVEVTPFPEGLGSLGNAVYFVVLVSVGATLIYVLLKRNSSRLIVLLTGFALTAAAFMLSFVYLSTVFSFVSFQYLDIVILVAAIVLTVLADFAIFRTTRAVNIAILAIGGALGTFLGNAIPTESTILILGFLAIYDVFAVYRGPVGKIAKGGIEKFRGLSFSFKDIEMGLGDLTFYSMLAGHMFIYFNWLVSVASIIGILLGCFLTFRILEKKGMFPGLPLPIFLGLTMSFIVFSVT
jgi:hypothetical protein